MKDIGIVILVIASNLLPLVFVAFMIAIFVNMFN